MSESTPTPTSPPAIPDSGNSIGVLRRREIEARIVAPLLEALGAEFGREAVLQVARETVIRFDWDWIKANPCATASSTAPPDCLRPRRSGPRAGAATNR